MGNLLQATVITKSCKTLNLSDPENERLSPPHDLIRLNLPAFYILLPTQNELPLQYQASYLEVQGKPE